MWAWMGRDLTLKVATHVWTPSVPSRELWSQTVAQIHHNQLTGCDCPPKLWFLWCNQSEHQRRNARLLRWPHQSVWGWNRRPQSKGHSRRIRWHWLSFCGFWRSLDGTFPWCPWPISLQSRLLMQRQLHQAWYKWQSNYWQNWSPEVESAAQASSTQPSFHDNKQTANEDYCCWRWQQPYVGNSATPESRTSSNIVAH